MKRFALTLFVLFMALLPASATWSIIMIDPKTGEIGIAGASCTYSVYGIGSIVPGKGAIVVQAMSNPLARMKGVQMIMANAAPDEIIAAIRNPDFDPEEQQYAVICLDYPDRPATYTGLEANPQKGALTAKGISVQGNTLAQPEALEAVLKTALLAQSRGFGIEEVLMLALETGARMGGDKRCGDLRASSAFLTVARPGDDPRKPHLNLVVYGKDKGVNAVAALRKQFDQWVTKEKD